jgi:hypothetical protein
MYSKDINVIDKNKYFSPQIMVIFIYLHLTSQRYKKNIIITNLFDIFSG